MVNIAPPPCLAYFISPHGYGHASRASAVMAALKDINPDIRFEIFTQIPAWFFEQSLAAPFGYHPLLTDIGLAQKNSLVEDIPATIEQLNSFLPFDRQHVKKLAGQVAALNCQLVVCDIAPLGIAVAHEAGLPSVLIENFTWDWIYEGYPAYNQQLTPHIAYLRQWFESADYHIQTEPVCRLHPSSNLITRVVSRKIRRSQAQIRQELGIPAGAKMVMMTMGGMNWDYTFLEKCQNFEDIYIVAAGNSRQTERRGHLIFLARNSGIFHPDLVNASDAVIGKSGYSTVAEVYQAGIPFGYVSRPQFREAPVMEDFIQRQMGGLPISEAAFQTNDWLARVPELLALPRVQRNNGNGADQIAEFIDRQSGL
jgi:UDP:flavonoid glycosyltransferase YjiC (YdhE family)